jgi:hypothetical protein
MLFAWVSSHNCAAIYNHALSPLSNVADTALSLSSEQVWHAFVLNALFREHSKRHTTLILPDGLGIDHDTQLKEAISSRNGQHECLHACDVCEKFILTNLPDAHEGLRPLRSVVTDGVTIGRPCCKIHNCTQPLINNRAHYCSLHQPCFKDICVVSDCSLHQPRFKDICVVSDCSEPVCPGTQTCIDPEHKSLEEYCNLKGKGFFLLQQRLQKSGASQLPSSLDSPANQVDDEDIDLKDPAHKSDLGNRQVHARFAHRRTHNEQLVVCTCGVIAARATMFGAEAVSGVKVLIILSLSVSHFLLLIIYKLSGFTEVSLS